jgi:non-homologous end joining protein Ku
LKRRGDRISAPTTKIVIEQQSGKFEPQKMPNDYAEAVHELVQPKVEQRAPEVEIETEKRETPKVVNIVDALKKSMQARGQAKVRDAVRRRMGKESAPEKPARASKSKSTTGARRSVH